MSSLIRGEAVALLDQRSAGFAISQPRVFGARVLRGDHVGIERPIPIAAPVHQSVNPDDLLAQLEQEAAPMPPDPAEIEEAARLQGFNVGYEEILRANPKVAVDQTAASGEYCFNSGQGTMVHFATQLERTPEDIVYEFDASGLIAAGLDPSRLQQLPERGQMTPGVWYFLPKGQQDPHHAHALANPTIAIAVNVK